jgi:hypothetical protein
MTIDSFEIILPDDDCKPLGIIVPIKYRKGCVSRYDDVNRALELLFVPGALSRSILSSLRVDAIE